MAFIDKELSRAKPMVLYKLNRQIECHLPLRILSNNRLRCLRSQIMLCSTMQRRDRQATNHTLWRSRDLLHEILFQASLADVLQALRVFHRCQPSISHSSWRAVHRPQLLFNQQISRNSHFNRLAQAQFGWRSGSTTQRSMVLATCFQTNQQAYSSTILPKLSLRTEGPAFIIMSARQSPPLRNRTFWPNISSLTIQKSFRKRLLFLNTSSHTSSRALRNRALLTDTQKRMLPTEKVPVRSLLQALSTLRSGWELVTQSCSD